MTKKLVTISDIEQDKFKYCA